jgi:putative flippase GtrA
MILITKNILAKLLEYEVARFLIVGGTTVLIDLIYYFILIYMGFDTPLSKGVSFSVGAVFAYFANRNYTFQSSMGGFFRFTVFILLYLSTLAVNVVSNEIVLKLTSQINGSLMIAFLIATSLSATLNFIGMKYIIFNAQKGSKY